MIAKGLDLIMFKAFPAEKEKTFLHYYLKATITQARVALGLCFFLYAVFAFVDIWIIPEIKNIAWIVRFGVVCPAIVLTFMSTYLSKKPYQVQTAMTILHQIGGLGIIVMVACSPSESNHLYYAGIILVTFIGYIFMKLRFVYATISGWALTLAYFLAAVFITDIPFKIVVNNTSFLFASNCMGMFACYTLELNIRQEYLQKLEIMKVNKKLKKLSNVDSLTQVANRRSFDKRLINEWNRCKRIKKPISMALLDIDFFKLYNDSQGHGAGDECIKKVAKLINDSVKRASDFVARYGGEEFAVIMSYISPEEAVERCENIRKAVETANIFHPESKIAGFVTVSLGIATTVPDNSMQPEDLVKFADQGLYRAKDKGRNCVEYTSV